MFGPTRYDNDIPEKSKLLCARSEISVVDRSVVNWIWFAG